MALLFAEGFDDLAVTDVPMRFGCTPGSHLAGCSMVTGRAGTGKAFSVDYDGEKQVASFANSTTVIIGFALWTNGYNASYPCVEIRNGGTYLMRLTCNNNNNLQIKDATNNEVGNITNWHGITSYVELKLTPGASGHLTAKCDGAVMFDANGNFGTGPANQVQFGTSAGYHITYDDVYICDTTGSRNNDFLGDTRILSAVPTADGADLQWTPSTGTAHYAVVDEPTPNGDTDYISSAAAGQSDTFTFPALTMPTGYGIVRALQVMVYAKSPVGGVDKIVGLSRIAGVDYPSTPELLVQAVYTGLPALYEVNPATGNPWTLSEINAAEFGLQRTA